MASTILHISKVAPKNPNCTASVIFLHGSGDTGSNLRLWIKSILGHDMAFPHIRVLYPTAPVRTYTPSNGNPSNVWFNRHSIAQNVPEDHLTIESMADELNKLIDQEVSDGIPVNRIIIGGFSMGGSMALQMAYRFRPDVAGAFVLSSFLNLGSKVYESLGVDHCVKKPPLFMCHGELDEIVSSSWGQHTYMELKKLGIQGTIHSFPSLYHEMNKKELKMLQIWISKHIPEI